MTDDARQHRRVNRDRAEADRARRRPGRIARLYEPSRYDIACEACKREQPYGHVTHRPIGEALPALMGEAAMPLRVAAARCGVSHFVVREWIKRGTAEIEAMIEDGRETPLDLEAQYVEFTEDVFASQGEAQFRMLATWRSTAAAKKDWRGFAAYMAEVWPESFGRSARTVVEVTGPAGAALGPVVPLEDIEALLASKTARLQQIERTRDAIEATGREEL